MTHQLTGIEVSYPSTEILITLRSKVYNNQEHMEDYKSTKEHQLTGFFAPQRYI